MLKQQDKANSIKTHQSNGAQLQGVIEKDDDESINSSEDQDSNHGGSDSGSGSGSSSIDMDNGDDEEKLYQQILQD